ncbi:MAG: trigger factor [Agathobacter sp.]|nr:trigger factor [Agathobacter sp.]
MSVQVEKLEKNMAKLTIEVSAEELEKAITAAYNKQKNSFNIPGFRKGKVPQAMVEKMYGVEVFYEEAANTLMQNSYSAAVEESGLDIVSRPTVDVVQIERGKAFIYTAEVAVKPEVTLGQYKGVEVTKVEIEVTEEEVAARLEEERNKNARTISVTDRAVVDGDTVVIDYAGSIDGVAFDGGTAEMQTLVIGSHSFIDTFEEQLIGHNIGDEVAVNVTFPEEYHAADLAGKPALFEVKIHEIKAKEVPELDDEFASDVSEFDTLEEYKEDLKKQLVAEKESEAKVAKENEAIQKIVEASEMEIPEAMIQTQCESMVDQFAQRISQSGLTMEQYFQFSGQTIDKLLEQVRPEAETQIKTSLVLDAVVAAEGVEATEEDITAELTKMSEMYGMDVETVRGYMGEYGIDSLKREITVTKAIELIMANVVEA